jgi:hypothetical protein
MRLFISSKSETFVLQNFPLILSFPARCEATKPSIAEGRGRRLLPKKLCFVDSLVSMRIQGFRLMQIRIQIQDFL